MYAILLYHGIDDGSGSARQMDAIDREYVLDIERFEAHVHYLAAKPSTSVRTIISFDDGDLSGFTVAAPVLERQGLRGEFFVVTRWIGQPGFMTVDHLRELARRGHGVHSHSRTHPRLPTLTPSQIEDELKGSKEDLEAALGRPVTQFSIPGGAYDRRVVDLARRAGYTAVMNSAEGYNEDGDTVFLRRRFAPRSYSDVSMLAGICERPGRTMARLTVKHTALAAARRLMGEGGYGKLRATIISRRRGEEEDTSRR